MSRNEETDSIRAKMRRATMAMVTHLQQVRDGVDRRLDVVAEVLERSELLERRRGMTDRRHRVAPGYLSGEFSL